MKFEMTERDKKLLIFLSVFVIVVCIGYWGVYPVIKDINSIKEKTQAEKDLKEMNEMKVAQLPMIEAENEKMNDEITTARNGYYEIMTSNEIDKHFTNLVLTSGLYSYDLNISISATPTDLGPYQYSKKALGIVDEELYDEYEEESAEDYLDDSEDEDDSDELFDEEEAFSATGIYTASISMKIGGDEEKLIAFLDSLCNTDKKLRVVSYSFSEERSIEYNDSSDEEGEESYDIKSNMTLDVAFEIYMCEE